MEKPLLQCRGLTKIYKMEDAGVIALKDIDLDIYPGEFICIVGTSGSGKSTLLYLLAGIERPTRGQIRVAGSRTDMMSEGELVRFRLQNVGFVFQSFNLMPYQTALENVALPLALQGVPSIKRFKAAAAMLKEVGLAARFKHKPGQLSGGQQQRVSIARALITSPKILFADEPTGNLDSHTGQEILELLRNQVKNQGTTLIMVTHDIHNARNADRIIHIADGEIVGETSPKEETHEEN